MFNRGSDGDGFILSVVFSKVENIQPTVVSSSREKHLTIPALRNKASTAESLEAIAPVCEDAALLPLSLAPGTKEAYQAAEGWKDFLKIEEVGKLVGDVNGDDIVNIVDVITTVNYILGNGDDTFDETVADMNDDGNVNIVDVTLIVNAI